MTEQKGRASNSLHRQPRFFVQPGLDDGGLSLGYAAPQAAL